MEKSHITGYQELQNFKSARKGVIQDYSENIKASVSILRKKSSAVIESTIHCGSKSIASPNDTKVSEISSFSSASNITTESNTRSNSNGSLIFGINVNAQKPITSNKTRLTISIADLIISEVFSFDIFQKPIFKKLLEMERNVSETYIPPNRNLISKELLGVIHEQNMKMNLSMIKKEAKIFGLLFLVDGVTISRFTLLNILYSGKTYQFLFW